MTEHVFLTGRKQVGKSTLIRKELERYKKVNGEGKIGGFLTVRTDAVYDGKYSVHMGKVHAFGGESSVYLRKRGQQQAG